MTSRERFKAVLNLQKPDDRLPLIEWAPWWSETINRWHGEGLSQTLPASPEDKLQDYFQIDPMLCLSAYTLSDKCPRPAHHGAPIITDAKSYDAIRQLIFTEESLQHLKSQALQLKARHEKGGLIIRLWLDGFFWFPRTLFGIEPHFYAFFDYPELMHRINNDLADFSIRAIEALCQVLIPDMAGFAEDMSYNHGPMLSKEMFKEFLMPYYHKVIPHLKNQGIPVLVDSDGEVTDMIPWLMEAGIQGVYPLERQAGVDVNKIRAAYPAFLMMGGFDKMVLWKGEEAIRNEFERLLPVMRSGGFIPSMDHQTPPQCSLENYRIYLALFREYAVKAAN